MFRSLFILLLFALPSDLFGQLDVRMDTLQYTTRMNSALDSIDISGAELPSTFDGGISPLSGSVLNANYLLGLYTQPGFVRNTEFKSLRFSALPYLGFSYTFGSQTAQFLRVNYVQAFRDSTLLNLSYRRNSGDGILRNSKYALNEVQLQFQHVGRWYSTRLNGFYTGSDLGHPGGLESDSLVGLFDLEFLDVRRSNAHSRARVGQVSWQNYVDVLRDRPLAVGPMIELCYRIENRLFTESGDLSAVYSQIFIDSLETRDEYNWANYANGLGLFVRNERLYVDVRGMYGYWQYRNLGQLSDSTEFDVRSSLRLLLGKIHLSNELKLNVLGRYQELQETLSAQADFGKVDAGLNAAFMRLAPSNFQRAYFSNAVSYTYNVPGLQQWLSAGAYARTYFWKNKIELGLRADYARIDRVSVFKDQSWVQDSILTNLFSASVFGQVQFGPVYFQPRLIVATDDKGYLPKFQAYGRVFVKGKMFKAKKLEALAGVDIAFVSAMNKRTFLPEMDTYNWFATAGSTTAATNLNAFVSLGIAEFRFFVRYENMGAFWWDKVNSMNTDYPMASRRFRIGLTWDFFN
jgi:hypothetical protein